jgi:hypothetical protein
MAQMLASPRHGAEIEILRVRRAVDIVASGVVDDAQLGQGCLHVEPGLEARGLRGQGAHAEFVDPQKEWLSSRDGQPRHVRRAVLPPAYISFSCSPPLKATIARLTPFEVSEQAVGALCLRPRLGSR